MNQLKFVFYLYLLPSPLKGRGKGIVCLFVCLYTYHQNLYLKSRSCFSHKAGSTFGSFLSDHKFGILFVIFLEIPVLVYAVN